MQLNHSSIFIWRRFTKFKSSKTIKNFQGIINPRAWFTRWARSIHGGFQLAPIGGDIIWGNLTYSVEDRYHTKIDRDNASSFSFGNVLSYTENDEVISPLYSNCHLQERDSIDIDMDGNGNIDFHVELNKYKDEDNVFDKDRDYNIYTHHSFDFDNICCKKPTEEEEILIESLKQNYSVANWTELLKVIDRRTYDHLMSTIELTAPTKDVDIADDSKYDKPRFWLNPLWRPLPFAPSMQIYCMYGTDLETARSYYFTRDFNASFKYSFRMNTNYNWLDGELVKNGFSFTNGDGTVPLLSLGFMCAKGWRNDERLNPSLMKIKIIEYRDKGENIYQRGFTMRGGKHSGDHIDIMGNQLLIKNILLIAMGYGNNDEYVKETVTSKIFEMSDLVNI